ncbi:MAG: DUF4406 domain-containing protein [Acetanaerobacterium sp.]
MKFVYICSPLRGDYEGNTEKAREYCRAATEMGVVPIAPHLLFPQFLDDTIPAERSQGLQMGLILLTRCDELWVCSTTISEGMQEEIKVAQCLQMPVRRLCAERREVSQPFYRIANRITHVREGVAAKPLPPAMV